MPMAQVADNVNMHYVIDDFTDPWSKPETILMLHGSCESGAMWFVNPAHCKSPGGSAWQIKTVGAKR